jgi:ubiquinone/menaquinone biosynthesis C-methylase UbiE
MDKALVKEQFGANAAEYVTSVPHARGKSLPRLLELTQPQPDWMVLDVATGAGHTALTFAPQVAQVKATDITPQMLAQAELLAKERGLTNLVIEVADAEDLPYDEGSFDLVTCRIAPHHFGNVARFVQESFRVLKPGGMLAVVDNVVPSGPAGDYVNAFDKLRDPSHGRCLALQEWVDLFTEAGFQEAQAETLDKQMTFEIWAARHNAVMHRYLLAVLTQGPPAALAFLQPQTINNTTTFRLQEGILTGHRPE